MICSNEKILDQLKNCESLRLFLDYDGTLADFAPTPDVVIPDPELIDLLARLTADPKISPAVISGRRLKHIRALLPLPGLWLAGTYGIELLSPEGERINRLDFNLIRPLLEAIKPEWEQLIRDLQGFYLEDKGWSLAIHARFADGKIAERVLIDAKLCAEAISHSSVLQLLGGDKFLEICPLNADKGLAIQYLIDQDSIPGALPVYIGDDDKDEKAFAAVKDRGGIAILVASESRATLADCRLESPKSVRSLLFGLIRKPTQNNCRSH